MSVLSAPANLNCPEVTPLELVFSKIVEIILAKNNQGLTIEETESWSELDEYQQYWYGGESKLPEELLEVMSFWDKIQKFKELVVLITQCKEKNVCEYDNEIAELRQELIENFTVYKVKFEPIIEYVHHFAESEKLKTDDDKEIEVLQFIVDGTQKIKGSIDSLLPSILEKM